MRRSRPGSASVLALTLVLLGRVHNVASAQDTDGNESRVVRRVTVTGNDRFRTAELTSSLQTRPGALLTERILTADREAILRKYYDDGYLLAEVRADVEERPVRGANVTFAVREGHRVQLQGVTVRGNEAYSTQELITASGLRPVKLFGVISRGSYIPGSVSMAIENLRIFYRLRGYFDVLVELEEIRLDDRKKRLHVEIRVVEGDRFRVVGVEISGKTVFPDELLLRQIRLPVGGHYSGDEVGAAGRRLRDWYLGHSDLIPRIRVRPLYGLDENVVTVVFEIDEGKHIFAGDVRIEGNTKTRDRVIRQQVKVIPGDPYDPTQAERSRAALKGRRIFEDVDIREVETDDEQIYDVEVTVTERERPIDFELGGGVSTGSGEVGYVRAGTANFDLFRLPESLTDWEGAFVGGGQLLEIEVIPGTRESQYGGRFVEPYLFSARRMLSTTVWSQFYNRESYDENRIHGELEVRQFLDGDHQLSLAAAYRVENVLIDDLDLNAPPDVTAAQGYTFSAYPQISFLCESVDYNLYSGPRGFVSEAVFDVAESVTGSDLSFTRLNVTGDLFLSFFDHHADFRQTLHIGAEAGWIDGLENDSVPLFERFFVGGPRSFRGFEYRRLGPHQLSTPVGGQALVRGTVQYSIPLFLRELRGVALFDWGNLERNFDTFSTGHFRTAVGGGLQLRFPLRPLTDQVVPVNLYWVQALTSQPGDEEQLFAFTFGFGF